MVPESSGCGSLTSEILLKLVIAAAAVGRRMLVLRIGIATVRVDARRRLSARMVHVERRRRRPRLTVQHAQFPVDGIVRVVIAHRVRRLRAEISEHSVDRRNLREREVKMRGSRPPPTRTYAGDVLRIARVVGQETIANLPGEYGRRLAFVLSNALDNIGRGHAWLRAADGARLDRTCFVVARENLRHAAVGHLQAAADVARTHAVVSELDDARARAVRQWTAVDEQASELVDSRVSWKERQGYSDRFD